MASREIERGICRSIFRPLLEERGHSFIRTDQCSFIALLLRLINRREFGVPFLLRLGGGNGIDLNNHRCWRGHHHRSSTSHDRPANRCPGANHITPRRQGRRREAGQQEETDNKAGSIHVQ